MNDVTFVITKDDIACGGSNPPDCPIAIAAKRRLPGSNPRVGNFYMRLFGKSYPMPEDASQFTENFDAGKRVEPFRFTLALEM